MIYSRINQLVCLQEFQVVFAHLDIRIAACISAQNNYDCNSAHKKQNKINNDLGV